MTDIGLRTVVHEDLAIFFEHQQDSASNAMAAFPARDRKRFLEHWARILGDASALARTVIADGEVAGNILGWDDQGDRAVGYWIGREHWGKGVATAALRAFLKLETTRPLYAHAATHNVGSLRVLEKCGFDVVREQHVETDDVDEYVLALGLEATAEPNESGPVDE